MATADRDPEPTPLDAIRAEILRRARFVICSHARPDGDSIGSQLALALSLRALGKTVRVVNADPAPPSLLVFPGVGDIEIADRVEGDCDAAVVLECSDLERTGVGGLDRYFLINIDHHPGNTRYGAIDWIDERAAACGEMVFDVIEALGVRLTRAIATHAYLTILSDTGGFHHSGISARTFDICRKAVEAGADPTWIARAIFESTSLGRLKLLGAVVSAMEIDVSGRLAFLYLDDGIAQAAGASADDAEGLINVPLSAKPIEAVVFLKQIEPAKYRVSLRSKGAIDVRAVASTFGGGGHTNAAGCTMTGGRAEVRSLLVTRVLEALDRAGQARSVSE